MVGGIEILGSVGLVFASTKKITANLLILMLVAFIASHWYFIQQGSCVENNICISPWIAWFRLIIIHPLLICLLFWIKKTPYGITIT